MAIPTDYLERVYAGILGKVIGVYLGRPFEGWSHKRILGELGTIRYYVNERLGKPLVVTDDDISGTFTFLRALPDFGNHAGITAAQIGQTWQTTSLKTERSCGGEVSADEDNPAVITCNLYLLFYGLTSNRKARILKRLGETVVLGEIDFLWEFEQPYEITLEVLGAAIAGRVDGKEILRINDRHEFLPDGGFAFVCQEGLITSDLITIKPHPADLCENWTIPDR